MSASHHADALPPGRVEEVADQVFAYVQPDGSWWVNNAGFVVGADGLVGVDACSTVARTQALREAVVATAGRPPRTRVNTHHHGDHTHGNALFPEATVVAHHRTRHEVLATGFLGNIGIWEDVDWGDVQVRAPSLTYADGITLWVDDRSIDVRHVGRPAHTTNDSYVWLPEQGVLFAGDLLFSGGTPFVLMGSVRGAVEALQEVVAPLAPRIVVPGHGPVRGPDVVDEVLAYLAFVEDTARAGIAAGVTPLECARSTDLGGFAELSDPERLAGNLHRAYADQTGGEVDLLAALSDMVALNGGRPLRCRA